MPLIDLKTNLKSLKYGKDTFGGGNSKQPFVQTSIPDDYLGKHDIIDFLGRQGGNVPLGTYPKNEFIRIGKFLSSPQGLSFIAKQEALQQQEVKRAADLVETNPAYVYNPISSLVSAAGGQLGFHPYGKGLELNIDEQTKYYKVYPKAAPENNVLIRTLTTKQSIKINDPNNTIISYEGGPGQLLGGKTDIQFADQRTGINNPLAVSNPEYFYSGSALHETTQNVNYNNLLGASNADGIANPTQTGFTADGQQTKVFGPSPNSGNSTLSKNQGLYNMVSGSAYGQGKPEHAVEDVNYNNALGASNAAGLNQEQKGINEIGVSNLIFGVSAPSDAVLGRTVKVGDYGSVLNKPNIDVTYSNKGGASQEYIKLMKNAGVSAANVPPINSQTWETFNKVSTSVYTPKNAGTFPKPSTSMNFYTAWNWDTNSAQSTVLNQLQLANNVQAYQFFPISQFIDFRKKLPAQDRFADAQAQTVIGGGPDYGTKNIQTRLKLGDPGRRSNRNVYNYDKGLGALDQINAKLLYDSSTSNASATLDEDMIKFAISAIDNDSPNVAHTLQFRAYLDSFNDSYTSQWDSQNYLGRGDKFYNYKGFDRSLNVGFTLAAQSREELLPMYKKLNQLASWTMPDYSQNGYLRGQLITLTVGDYIVDQPGWFGGLTLDFPNDSPWEINIDMEGNKGSLKELSHVVKVSGFKFTPIHNFLARSIYDNSVNKTNALFAFQKD